MPLEAFGRADFVSGLRNTLRSPGTLFHAAPAGQTDPVCHFGKEECAQGEQRHPGGCGGGAPENGGGEALQGPADFQVGVWTHKAVFFAPVLIWSHIWNRRGGGGASAMKSALNDGGTYH